MLLANMLVYEYQEYMKTWLIDCLNIYDIGLIMLRMLDIMAAAAMIHMPSILMVTGKSPKSYLCRPIIHATKVPTATPIRHEFRTSTYDSYTNILAILDLL